MTFDIEPATWESFSDVMGENGGCGGCWCMLWRQSSKDMTANMGVPNRRLMHELFETGAVPGLVASRDGRAVGWIQVAPRSDFPRLDGSRILQPVDDRPVWSVSCFLVHKDVRRQGLSRRLLEAACDFARDRGAAILEGYPIDTPKEKYPAVYAWTGFAGAYRAAGFAEVALRSPTRPIMRRALAAG